MSKGDLTKERIIAKAAPVFNRNGFSGTSLSELMAATRLQKGGIYRHFKSKEELAAAAFDHTWHRAWHSRWVGIERSADAIAQLRQLVGNFVDNRSELVPGGCPVLNTAVDCDDGNRVLRDRARDALEQWTNQIGSIVTVGIESTQIRKGVDPQAIATVIIATLEGALMITRLRHSDSALKQAREYLEGFLESLTDKGLQKNSDRS